MRVQEQEAVSVPPATKPDSPSCMATPNPPSLTGAEFSFEANNTQWGCGEKGKTQLRNYAVGFVMHTWNYSIFLLLEMKK